MQSLEDLRTQATAVSAIGKLLTCKGHPDDVKLMKEVTVAKTVNVSFGPYALRAQVSARRPGTR